MEVDLQDDDLDEGTQTDMFTEVDPQTQATNTLQQQSNEANKRRRRFERTKWFDSERTAQLLDLLIEQKRLGRALDSGMYRPAAYTHVTERLAELYPLQRPPDKKAIQNRLQYLRNIWGQYKVHVNHTKGWTLDSDGIPTTDLDIERKHFNEHKECMRFQRKLPPCFDKIRDLFSDTVVAIRDRPPRQSRSWVNATRPLAPAHTIQPTILAHPLQPTAPSHTIHPAAPAFAVQYMAPVYTPPFTGPQHRAQPIVQAHTTPATAPAPGARSTIPPYTTQWRGREHVLPVETNLDHNRKHPSSTQHAGLFKAAEHVNDRKHHLLLAATGSVATIKIPNMVRALEKHDNLSIRILLTDAAAQFLQGQSAEQPSLGAISRMKNVDAIYRDSDEWRKPWVRGDNILHIELRRWADLMVITPLSADSLAKLASGISDNLVLSVARAWDTTGLIDGARSGVELPYGDKKGIIVAPAMNTAMWNHPVTARHMRTLQEDWGVENGGWIEVIRPVEKALACGDTGSGAMRNWEDMVGIVEKRLYLTREGEHGVSAENA